MLVGAGNGSDTITIIVLLLATEWVWERLPIACPSVLRGQIAPRTPLQGFPCFRNVYIPQPHSVASSDLHCCHSPILLLKKKGFPVWGTKMLQFENPRCRACLKRGMEKRETNSSILNPARVRQSKFTLVNLWQLTGSLPQASLKLMRL